MTIRIYPYSCSEKERWDAFIKSAKNGTFLHLRSYMDYHSDRFEDASLLIFEDGNLLALFPATIKSKVISSHGGLTFGGLILPPRFSAHKVDPIFKEIFSFYKGRSVENIRYKVIPHIYHTYPSQEDLYYLFRINAKRVRVDLSTTIDLLNRLPYSKGRKSNISKAEKNNLIVRESLDFDQYFNIVEKRLSEKYQTKPTHSPGEMQQLQQRHPENIKLIGTFSNNQLLAGAIIYISTMCVHTQYMASSEIGRDLGALDLAIDYIIKNSKSKRYFDFGISTENSGQFLNFGLLRQKEMFGGQSTVYETYDIDLNSFDLNTISEGTLKDV